MFPIEQLRNYAHSRLNMCIIDNGPWMWYAYNPDRELLARLARKAVLLGINVSFDRKSNVINLSY